MCQEPVLNAVRKNPAGYFFPLHLRGEVVLFCIILTVDIWLQILDKGNELRPKV